MEGLAWLVSLAGAATAGAVALAPLTGRATFPALYVTALGVATLWLGYGLDWHGPRWPMAIVADVLVGVVALRARAEGGGEGVAAAYAVQAVLMVSYLGSIAARTLLLGRRVVPFEIFQAAAARNLFVEDRSSGLRSMEPSNGTSNYCRAPLMLERGIT